MGESSAIECLLLNHEILCPIHNRARMVYATIFFLEIRSFSNSIHAFWCYGAMQLTQ